MSETLLEALMQLFALLTDVHKEKKSGRARFLVEDYLKRHFNSEYVQQYLLLFDKYLKLFHNAVKTNNQQAIEKESNDNYQQILDICRKLNLEMEQEPKVLLFVQLLEFLKKEEDIGGEENHLIDTLSVQMKIESSDYDNLKVFILDNPSEVEDKESVLIISGSKEDGERGFKHIFNINQQVTVWVLRIKSTNTFIFRYSGSRNLYLNGHNIEQMRGYVLASGAVIKTSRMAPVYYGRVAEMFLERQDRTRIIYRAIDVEYKFNPNQTGIHPFSFVGRSGQLVGIIGGSGTGKSTLLNVLNGNLKLNAGKISINGFDLHKEKAKLDGVIGYVPQMDLLIEELTVFENLYYNARFCFSELEEHEIMEKVDAAIHDFDLVEARDLVVGNPLNKILSGGQRKRLNIALELIREPSILFVDEPTSGLSSMDSEKVMSVLKRQTLKGRLVIINIHQPSSDLYKLLDKLLIIDKGGRIIYNGNPMDAIVYFKKMANYVNPEERECYVCGNVKTEQPLRIIEARMVNPYGKLIRERKIKPHEWYELYHKNIEKKFKWKTNPAINRREALPPNLFSVPKRWKQFLIYTSRDALAKVKDKQYLLINFLEAPILALILGFFTKFIGGSGTDGSYVFSENVNLPAYLFMSVVVALFLGLNVSAEEIIKDRKLLQRESFLNLSRSGYLNSKVITLFVISAIQTLSFVLIGNGILEIKGLTFSYWLILFSTACFANILGLNISSGLSSVVAIYILIPLILVPQLLFSGVIVQFDKLHKSISSEEYVSRIGDMMTSRWAFEALSVNQFMNNKFERNFFDDEKMISTASYHYSLLIPELEVRNNEALWALQNNQQDKLAQELAILSNELKQLQSTISADAWEKVKNGLQVGKFSKETNLAINAVLDRCKKTFQQQYRVHQKRKDAKYGEMVRDLGSSEAVFELKEKYHNKTLADWVLEKQNLKQIVFSGEKYIRKKHPIFKDALSNCGRAHFYASHKRLGYWVIPTPWFNTMVIWLTIGILYFSLYFDLLKKLLAYFDRFKLRRLNRKLQKINT